MFYLTMNEQCVSILYYYSYSLIRRIGSTTYLSRMQNKEKKMKKNSTSITYYLFLI